MRAIESLLREYYSKAELVVPPDLELREIALQPLSSSTYIRHLSFPTIQELRKAILERIPRHVYFSSAKYREPANPDMEMKGWLGSDLVFDIDADHLPQCSDKVVEFKFCSRCGYVTSEKIDKCPRCGSSLEEFSHVEEECIELAKLEVAKLIDILRMDFGYQNLTVAFSGNRGFHVRVHLEGEDAMLPSDARREIVDYLKMSAFNVDSVTVIERRLGRRRVMRIPPSRFDVGARRRVYLELKRMGLDVDRALASYSMLRSRANDINSAIMDAVENARIEVDEKVTIDVSRLVRIPNSVNGKSGWIALHVKDLGAFELSEDVVSPVKEELRVKIVIDLPRVRILGHELRARRGEVLSLSPAVALYLVFKGVASFLGVRR